MRIDPLERNGGLLCMAVLCCGRGNKGYKNGGITGVILCRVKIDKVKRILEKRYRVL